MFREPDESHIRRANMLSNPLQRRQMMMALFAGLMVVLITVVAYVERLLRTVAPHIDLPWSELGTVWDRTRFHRRQVEFQGRCDSRKLIGKQVERAFPFFGGRPPILGSYGKDWECGWKEWPCELIVRDGTIVGVFYHDYPYSSQPLPENSLLTHSKPYFERFPEHLRDDYAWDESTFLFEKKQP